MIDDKGDVFCDRCGKLLGVGEYPFCPHGFQATAITTDEIPGGVLLENYGPTPVRVYSHTERRKLMEKQGLREKETFCPTPGSDIDPAGIPNPAGYSDPQTLANAAALICRNGARDTPFDPESVMPITTGHMSDRDALRVTLTGEK